MEASLDRDRDRRRRDRRRVGRRAEDPPPSQVRGAATLWTTLWALVGAVPVLYLFFVALGGIDPGDAPAATIIAGVLALLWVVHAWRRLLYGGASPAADRERRGF